MTLSEGRFSALPRAPNPKPITAYTIQKNDRWSRLFILFGTKRYTNYFVAINSDFVFFCNNAWICKWTRDNGFKFQRSKNCLLCCVCYCVKRETLLSTLLLLDGYAQLSLVRRLKESWVMALRNFGKLFSVCSVLCITFFMLNSGHYTMYVNSFHLISCRCADNCLGCPPI